MGLWRYLIENNIWKKCPPFCPSCDITDNVWKNVICEIEQEFKGVSVKFNAEVSCCKNCNFKLLTDKQTDCILKKTRELIP